MKLFAVSLRILEDFCWSNIFNCITIRVVGYRFGTHKFSILNSSTHILYLLCCIFSEIKESYFLNGMDGTKFTCCELYIFKKIEKSYFSNGMDKIKSYYMYYLLPQKSCHIIKLYVMRVSWSLIYLTNKAPQALW